MTGSELVVLSTAPTAAEGETIGRRLVEEHLAACVNVLPGARSIFFWAGQVHETDEAALVRYADLERRIAELHSCSVPEVLALPVASGSPAYVAWLHELVAVVEGGDG